MKLPGLKREELDGNWGKRENPDSHRGIRGEDEDSRKNRLPGGDATFALVRVLKQVTSSSSSSSSSRIVLGVSPRDSW
jgi:hypothetical protein